MNKGRRGFFSATSKVAAAGGAALLLPKEAWSQIKRDGDLREAAEQVYLDETYEITPEQVMQLMARVKELEQALSNPTWFQGQRGKRGQRGDQGLMGEMGPPGISGRYGLDVLSTEDVQGLVEGEIEKWEARQATTVPFIVESADYERRLNYIEYFSPGGLKHNLASYEDMCMLWEDMQKVKKHLGTLKS